MKKNFDCIDYPLKLNDKAELIFQYTKTKIEFRIMNTIDSKKIYATKQRFNDLILLLKIEDNEVSVIGHTTNFYQFEGPLDFYIDNMESHPFYYNLGNKLINGSITELLDTSQIISNKFLTYTPPIINHYETAPKKVLIQQNVSLHKSKQEIIRVYYNDKTPINPTKILKLINDDAKIQDFLLTLPHPILKISNILILFSTYKKSNNLHIKNDKLKAILPFFRYFIINGPFRKAWVSFGYDPKKDKSNYKYQIIDLRAEGTFFHLFEKETIINEVEKNMEWYVKDECDIKNGFFKKTLIQLILYGNYIKFKSVKEEEEECFTLYD